jgi:hypothetical protein
VVHAVEHCKALNSNPSPTKKEKEQQKNSKPFLLLTFSFIGPQ